MRHFLTLSLLNIAFFAAVPHALADTGVLWNGGGGGGGTSGGGGGSNRPDRVEWQGEEDILGFLDRIANFVYGAFFIIAVIMIVYAAFLYLTSAGNESRVDSAKKTLIAAVGAIVLALLAWAIPWIIRAIMAGG